jgi:hypothetical protein
MSKFKIGDRVCTKRFSTYNVVKHPGTIIEITGVGSGKRYVVQLDTPLFPDSKNPYPTTSGPARNFKLISDVEAEQELRARHYAEFLASQS